MPIDYVKYLRGGNERKNQKSDIEWHKYSYFN